MLNASLSNVLPVVGVRLGGVSGVSLVGHEVVVKDDASHGTGRSALVARNHEVVA